MPPPNGSSGPTLPSTWFPDRHVREVHDQVGPLGEPHQEPAGVVGGQVHRRSQEAALVADLPHLDARDGAEVEDEESRLAAVQEAEPVPALLDDLERPRGAVRDEHVAEELRVPDRRELADGDVVADDLIEERPRVGVEQRPVVVERAILHGDRDLVVRLVRRELVVLLRGGAREHGRGAGTAVEHRIVPSGPPRMRKKPAGPAYTFTRVMPSVWSWYQIVEARWVLGYWNVANPGPHSTPYRPPPCRRRSRTTCPPSHSRRGCRRPPAGTTPRRSRRSRRRRRRSRAHG